MSRPQLKNKILAAAAGALRELLLDSKVALAVSTS
jgi:hypothetical protein